MKPASVKRAASSPARRSEQRQRRPTTTARAARRSSSCTSVRWCSASASKQQMAKRIVTYTPKRQRDGWTRYLRLIGKTEEPPMAASSTWTRIRRPAAGAPAAGARVGGRSAAHPTAGAAGRAIRRTTCGPIRSESTTSRRHCQSRPGRCCDPVPQALATDRSAACMPDRLGRGVSGSPSRCLSRLKRWPCRPVWPRRVRHRAGSLDQGISGGALFRCRSAPHWRPMARARRITTAGRCVVLPSAPAGRRHSSRPGRLDAVGAVSAIRRPDPRLPIPALSPVSPAHRQVGDRRR